MAFPNDNIGDIVATTIENRRRRAADNITRNNVILNYMEDTSSNRPFSGGRTLWEEIEYAMNGTVGWYAGYDALDISPQNIMTSAEFLIRQAAVAVSMSGLEDLQNAGREQMIDLLSRRIDNAERSLQNLITVGINSDGAAPKQIEGIQKLISTSPATGSVGGISAVNWTFWRNIAFSGVTDGGAPTSAANINNYMDRVWVQLERGNDKPNLIQADSNYWLLYKQSLQPHQIISSSKSAEAGFSSLRYMGADVVNDGGFQGYSTDPIPTGGPQANTMRFINTRYLSYRPHRRRNFSAMGGRRNSVNQDAFVQLMGWAGNMTISNRRLNGVLSA